jgi:Tfp pilus assembly protein PilX
MTTTLRRTGEEGMALVLAMFMVLVVSLVGAAAMVTTRTETLSSMQYRTTSQARYAAESGVHHAINHLLNDYAEPLTAAQLASYVQTQTAVQFNGDDIVLSSDDGTAGHYPVEAAKTAFHDAVTGTLDVSNGTASYSAVARLRSIRTITDAFSGAPATVQTWEITGIGSVGTSAEVEVSAVLEEPVVPLFRYAAFATATGCAAMSFAGGATTDSYDSAAALVGGTPVVSPGGGNVGTNGNVTEAGNTTTINGSLSTPRAGVGACNNGNVTALTLAGGASVEDGLIELPQNVSSPTPETPNPPPPTTATGFSKNSGCPVGLAHCVVSANGATITPPTSSSVITMGNVALTAQADLHLGAGIYVVNSISMAGNSRIIVDSGPVIFKVVGTDKATPIDLTGGAISNPGFDPTDLQFVYGGSGIVKIAGGAQNAALLYAPNAATALTGNNDFYGALVTGVLTATGGVNIHYDRRLQNVMLTPGNTTMSKFTWRVF